MPSSPDHIPVRAEVSFVEALKRDLERLNISQQALADAMSARGHKFHQATVYKILRGTRKLSLDEATDIADILNADIGMMTAPPLVDSTLEQLRRLKDLRRQAIDAVTKYRSKWNRVAMQIEVLTDEEISKYSVLQLWRDQVLDPQGFVKDMARIIHMAERQVPITREDRDESLKRRLSRESELLDHFSSIAKEDEADGEHPEAPER